MILSELTHNRENLSANQNGQSGEFISALIHEIRNPLTNINMALESLKLMLTDDTQRMYLDIVTRSSGKINTLVTDLLVSTQVHEVIFEECSIHQLLDEILEMAADRILLKNITVTKIYDDQDCKAVIDSGKMKIALTNIIINAIEAMSSENGQLGVKTRYQNEIGIYVEIEDNGIGINEKHLTSIFEPYYTNKPGGIGLGLSTTLDILLTNHVTTEVRSKEGAGTQFILFFNC